MDLQSIPGVGEKTADALAALDDPETALQSGDVAALAEAPRLSEARAARVARAAIRMEHDEDGDFLATDRAREIYRDLLGMLKARTVTDYAAKRLETLYPSTQSSRIEEVQSFARDAMGRDPSGDVIEALADVSPLDTPTDVRVRERCLATRDGERYAEAREAFPELSVEAVEDARDLAELARGYSTVIALDSAFGGVDVEGDVRVDPDAFDHPEEIVPERPLAFFARNRGRIQAAIEVHRAADLDPPCELAALETALARLDEDGDVVGDDELDRLSNALEDLDGAVAAAESEANDRLREAIRDRDVTIEGSDLLSLVEQGASVDSLLDQNLSAEFETAVSAARESLVETLDLTDHEAEIARRAFPEEPTFPIECEGPVVERLRTELRTAVDRRAVKLKTDLAATLAEFREDVRTLVRTALELDVELAIARFARDFECTLPAFDGTGIEIEGGCSPLLDEPLAEIDPVDYAVEDVTLLTGVNSGGKTSTLDLVASVVVLAHMGLPVPADRARLARFDSLHYHTKSRGTLDAGAFEHTLREFQHLVADADGALVLVDELESITEPGASATIVAGILEQLAEADATAIFVSHLAGEISAAAGIDVTVDGIEARGLEDGELRVDRSPRKDHFARSTPELIVEKLTDETDVDFYDRLLAKFDGE